MIHKIKRLTIAAVLVSCILFFCVGTALAADDEEDGIKIVKTDGKSKSSLGNSNYKISSTEFLSNNPDEDTKVIDPQMDLIMSFALKIFVFVSFLTIVWCATQANAGTMLKNFAVRNGGIIGIFLVLAVILIASVAWMAIPELYNEYIVGNITGN